MRALIQYKKNKPYSVSARMAEIGFEQLGYEVVPFNYQDFATIDWQREEPVVGGVGTINRLIKHFGADYSWGSYPISLANFCKRVFHLRRLDELTQGMLPMFIKPAFDDKKFTGFVCYERLDPRLAGLEPDLFLNTCSSLDMIAEYRTYVLDGKILAICRYKGPVDRQPNMRTVRGMIMSHRPAPIAYSLDVAVTADNETILVEVNDALSLGNYGLPPSLAARMHLCRWNELMGLPFVEEAKYAIDSPAFISEP